ncbi:MAG: hypothetical protein P8X58_02090 [Syntrophobacterales bacterium]
MFKKKRFNWGRRSSFFLAGLALGGLALIAWMVLGSLDWGNPWLEVSDQVAVVSPNTAFTLKAGDRGSGLKEIKVTVSQRGQEKVALSRSFPPGGEVGSTVEMPVRVKRGQLDYVMDLQNISLGGALLHMVGAPASLFTGSTRLPRKAV